MSILIVDDDQEVADSIATLLAQCGHETEIVDNGQLALERLQAETFDLLIVDMIMPEMDGLEVIKTVRDTDGTIPIVAMSGGGRVKPEYYLRMATMFGANLTVKKPVMACGLIEAVASLLSVRRANNRPRAAGDIA